MTRSLKALGLALVAIFAMSAVVASAASASKDVVFTNSGTTYLKQDDDIHQVISTPAGSITCEVTEFNGTIKGSENEAITIEPEYSQCDHSLVGPAPMINEGCHYVLTGNTGASGHAPIHILCQPNKHITIELSGVFGLVNCDLTIGSQTPAEGVRYTNQGSGNMRDVTVDITASEVRYTKDAKGGGGCTLVGGNGEDGVYSGADTLTGFSDPSYTTRAPIHVTTVQ
jgi:hypothetical protein